MNLSFELDHERLAADPEFADVAEALSGWTHIYSCESFNRYCRQACAAWGAPRGETSARFADLLGRIERREEGTIATPWGGTVIILHEPPQVEKYLVVRRGHYLPLEKHALKDERINVIEGAGLLLSRRGISAPLSAEVLSPEEQFHFQPGMEHCIIGAEDLLVFENAIDPKGMDQDLIFVYEPS